MCKPLDRFQFHPNEWGFFSQRWIGDNGKEYLSICFGCMRESDLVGKTHVAVLQGCQEMLEETRR